MSLNSCCQTSNKVWAGVMNCLCRTSVRPCFLLGNQDTRMHGLCSIGDHLLSVLNRAVFSLLNSWWWFKIEFWCCAWKRPLINRSRREIQVLSRNLSLESVQGIKCSGMWLNWWELICNYCFLRCGCSDYIPFILFSFGNTV